MRKDAEAHADEDKKKRELAEARNQVESMSFQLEKLMKENESKLSASDKQPLEAAIAKARETAKGDNVQAIKSAITELEQAAAALQKSMYASANAGGAGGPQPGDTAAAGARKSGGDDEAIDAEFEVKE